jgi:AcrR family transcriptional regulator
MTYLRKRPRQTRAQATFDAIVEAAARILLEDGASRVTTNHVAARAGVSIGSLYQYFPDRRGIVRALVERELARAEALRPATIDDPTLPLAVRVRAIVDWHLDAHGARPALARALRGLVQEVLPKDEIRRLSHLRTARVTHTVATLRMIGEVDLEIAVFIIDTCLDALSDGATARRPAWLQSERFREEVAALIRCYLERHEASGNAARAT